MAISANLTKLSYQNGSSYEDVFECVSISGPDNTVPERDTSHLGSMHATSAPGVPDIGSCTATVYFDLENETHAFVYDLAIGSPVVLNWRKTYANGIVEDFAGYVTQCKPDFSSLNDNVTAEVSIRGTGALTYGD